MLVTSLTTALAFGAAAASPLMPSSQFGIFAATMVVVNYVVSLSLMPFMITLSLFAFKLTAQLYSSSSLGSPQ
jgi:hypothetical protein